MGSAGVNRRGVAAGLMTVGAIVAIWLVLPRREAPSPVIALDRSRFGAEIALLARDDTPSHEGMWRDPILRSIAAGGAASVDDALAFLGCGCRSQAEVGVTVRAMYLLPLGDYLRFLDGLMQLYDRGAVAAPVVAMSVQIPDAFSTALQHHFDDVRVRQTLGGIAARGALPQGVKDSIADLLAGRTWAQTRSFCRERIFETVADCRTVGWLDLL